MIHGPALHAWCLNLNRDFEGFVLDDNIRCVGIQHKLKVNLNVVNRVKLDLTHTKSASCQWNFVRESSPDSFLQSMTTTGGRRKKICPLKKHWILEKYSWRIPDIFWGAIYAARLTKTLRSLMWSPYCGPTKTQWPLGDSKRPIVCCSKKSQ